MITEPHMASPLPWRITEPGEKKSGREIVDAKGTTVARLTALDMANAELIVSAVNEKHRSATLTIDLSDRCPRCLGGKDLKSNKCPAGKCDCEFYPKEKLENEVGTLQAHLPLTPIRYCPRYADPCSCPEGKCIAIPGR